MSYYGPRATCDKTDAPRRGRLRCLHTLEQLIEHPDQVVVVRGPEDLGHEGPSLDQELGCQFQTHEHKLRLRVRVLHPGSTDVGSTIVQYDVGLPVLEFAAEESATLWGRDIACKGDNARNGLDWHQVNT